MTYKASRLLASALLVLAYPSAAAPPDSSAREEVVASDIAVRDTRIVEKIQIPETSPAVEVRLQVANPEQLDLDLFLYDSEPIGSSPRPICISDSVQGNEVCAVKRPDSGMVWALIVAVDGVGKSPFILTRSLVDSSREELALAEPISPNGLASRVGAEKASFQFTLKAGEVAAVVLDGEERAFTVEDEDGHSFPARKTGIGRQQAAVGKEFQTRIGESTQKLDWLLRGAKDAKSYLVKIGPSGNPYGKTNTTLAVVLPMTTDPYLIVYSVENLDNEPNTIEGPPRKLTRPGTRNPVLFKFLPSRSPSMIGEALPDETYDIALCDEFGFVLSISSTGVLWNPKRESAIKTLRSSETLYFVVFPSPFTAPPVSKPPELTLLIKPPETP